MEHRKKRKGYRNSKRRPLLIAAIASVAVAIVLLAVVSWCMNLSIDLQVNGGTDPVTVVFGKETYLEKGAAATADGKQLDVTIDGSVDNAKLGVYKITYRAQYLWLTASAQREVRVIDTTAPVIDLKTNSDYYVIPGQPYEEEGFTATDDYDGDITAKVERSEADGKVTYTVKDSSGNETVIVRQLGYADVTPPEIVLEGETSLTLTAGGTYTEPGYTATDDVDGDLTDKVEVSGEVDCSRAGTYTITYTVKDSFGNAASVTRTVKVKAAYQPPAVDSGDGEKVIYLTFDDGPGPYTQKLLDILAKYNVKATFFVVNTDYNMNTLLNNIVNGGHSIGIHSVTHEYDDIYASEEAFFNDLYSMQAIIENYTGVRTYLSRFPGGSLNANRSGMENVTQRMKDEGFRYFDWHVDSDDWKDKNTEMTIDKIISRIGNRTSAIVLQHDIHATSVEAVESVIIWALQNGYTFKPLTTSSPACEQVS